MNPRNLLAAGLLLGLAACGRAPDILETVQTRDVNGNPITLYRVNCQVAPPCYTPPTPEQERAEIDYWTDYHTRNPGAHNAPDTDTSPTTVYVYVPTYAYTPRVFGPYHYGGRFFGMGGGGGHRHHHRRH